MGALVRLPPPGGPSGELAEALVRFRARSSQPNASGPGLWDEFGGRAPDGTDHRPALRELLGTASEGRCAYCEDIDPKTVDHYRPKSRFPRDTFELLNLLLACERCNRAKDDSFPTEPTGQPLLLNPYVAEDDPLAHLSYTGYGAVAPLAEGDLGERARETIGKLELSRGALRDLRARTWWEFVAACENYLAGASAEAAAAIAQALQSRDLHRGVLRYLMALSPTVRQAVADAASEHPAVRYALARKPYCWE